MKLFPPITRLRLRAEFVEDDEQRRKLLRDVDDMEAMIDATLAFTREEASIWRSSAAFPRRNGWTVRLRLRESAAAN